MDPLRFDMYAQRIGNVFLPGITNRVERLRYFGMVCAGIALTRPHEGRVSDPRVIREWRRRVLPFEAGWALATVVAANGQIKDVPPLVDRARLKWEYQGFRGANRVLDYYRRTAQEIDVKPNNYLLLKAQEAQGGLGAYLVALRTYGFVQSERFDLTPFGTDLAGQFLRGVRQPEQLLGRDYVARRSLQLVGEKLSLARAPKGEADLVGAALFEGDHEAARMVRRIPLRLRRPERSEEAMRAVARRDGDPLERAAQFALDFDPVRTTALTLFSALGRRLMGRAGPALIREVRDEAIDGACEALKDHAAVLMNDSPPAGLEPIADLAHRLATADSCENVIEHVLAFHRQEGRRWIELVGAGRVAIALPGRFDPPRAAFHGYTLPSALRVYRDIQDAA